MKYILTDFKKELFGHTLFQIKALVAARLENQKKPLNLSFQLKQL